MWVGNLRRWYYPYPMKLAKAKIMRLVGLLSQANFRAELRRRPKYGPAPLSVGAEYWRSQFAKF